MFVDIHTHNYANTSFPTVRNLTLQEAERIFSSDKKGLFSVGFHPWHADKYFEKSVESLEKWATDNRLILIGECGLDKNSQVSMKIQVDVFQKQILLSEQVQKPMIIHCVGCFNELLELKKQQNPRQLWIIHGFRGKPELAKQVLKAGCALSFGEHFNVDSVRITPIEMLFVETDESTKSLETIYLQIAEIKGVEPNQLIAGKLLIDIFMAGFKNWNTNP